MIESNEGNTIAITTMTIRISTLIIELMSLRMKGDLSRRGSSGARARKSMPHCTSNALMIGEQLEILISIRRKKRGGGGWTPARLPTRTVCKGTDGSKKAKKHGRRTGGT